MPCFSDCIEESTKDIGINIDQCIFCALCAEVCPGKAITMSQEFELAEKDRQSLRKGPLIIEERDIPDDSYELIGKKN